MNCSHCNNFIPQGSAACPTCGAPVQAPAGNGYQQNMNQNNGYQQPGGYQQQPGGYQQPGYQQPYNQYQQPYNQYQQPYGGYNANPDVPSTGFNVLGFFFPIVGLILYLVWKDQTPNKAKAIGKSALISFIIGVVFYIIVFAISFAVGLAGSLYYYM